MSTSKTPSSVEKSRSVELEVGETISLEFSESAEPLGMKQEADLAFAIVLLGGGRISERQLTRALEEWTAYGNRSLADWVTTAKLITPDEKRQLLSESARRLKQAVDSTAGLSTDQSKTQITNARMAHLDSSGRVSKLLGLGGGAAAAASGESRQLFTRFSLIRKLGQGGLGTVWLAKDENLRRYVAIKEIRAPSNNASDPAIARFRREAEVTGRLEHPGIVPIYEFGTDTETGRYFYVMRFLGKQTMQDAITEYHERREAGTQDPLLMHRLLTSFVKLCNSVAHAHSRKVIHRDLKPENVALDSFGQVVLLDWGLAKINDELGVADAKCDAENGDLNEASLTIASQVLGSPMYMSPEQAAGRVDEIDERTDVYGLGGILFAILTGNAPHEQTNIGGDTQSMADLLADIVGKPVPRPRQVLSSVPQEIDAICAKAMQKKPYLRYASALAVAEDMERYMAGGKVTAYDEPFSWQIKRWIAAHPKISQFGALATALLLLALGFLGYSVRQTQLTRQAFEFLQATDIAKELIFDLETQANNGVRDSRFLTGLPPVAEIVARRENAKAEIPASQNADSEDVWRDRLGSIFEGLLNRNDSYLGIVFVEFDEDVNQILRAERNRGANIVRRVPDSLLKTFPKSTAGPSFSTMLPGDVILQTSDKINKDAPTNFRDPLVLTAINSVFSEESGELFGLMVIQLDIRQLLIQRIESMGRSVASVYVTDGSGNIEIQYEDGNFVLAGHHASPLQGRISMEDGLAQTSVLNELPRKGISTEVQPSGEMQTPPVPGVSIVQQFPELEDLFGANPTSTKYSDGTRLFAVRLSLGAKSAQSDAFVGVVIRVSE